MCVHSSANFRPWPTVLGSPIESDVVEPTTVLCQRCVVSSCAHCGLKTQTPTPPLESMADALTVTSTVRRRTRRHALNCTALHCIALHCTALQGERRATRRHACREATHALGCLGALTHFRFFMWAPPYASLLPTAAFPVTVMWMLATVVYHSTAARTSISSLSRSASKTITPPPSDALASQSSLITGNVLSDLYRPLNRLSHANRTANRDATESFVHAVNT